MIGRTILLLLFLCPFVLVYGQVQRCATEEIRNGMPTEPIEQFEFWLLQKKQELRTRSLLRSESTVQIPVVVHIIHNGEPIGTGINLNDQQILSQIQVINEDFSRTNPDMDNTPIEFLPVAADSEVEFVLAKQDPEGLPTTGIKRVDGNRSSWSWAEQIDMKALSFWPSEDYLNIWVTDLTGSGNSNVLGFAIYPETTLQGVDFGGTHRLVDGVSIDYTVFGSSVIYPDGNYNSKFDRGRTLTHELGHYFGLRHIWGDGFSCGATDYCDDTPSQLNDTSGCPASKSTCASTDMIQNFMDYTNDACMNLFTEDQKSRMQIVLSSSPRRLSLITSHGLQDPAIFINDAGIFAINAPGTSLCPGTFIPQIEIRNYGSAALSSITVDLQLDGSTLESKTETMNLGYLNNSVISFSSLSSLPGTYSFEITEVNGTTDQNELTNKDSTSVSIPQFASTPLSEGFDFVPSNWTILNPDADETWKIASAPADLPNNKAMVLENYDYEALGELDYLISPILDMSAATAPFLHFDVAYAQYPSEEFDALSIGIIKNCDNSTSAIDVVYFKEASELSTKNPTAGNFIPINSSDWRTESFISLEDYIGEDNVQIAFISRAGFGNNLYIDNVQVTTQNELDIKLNDVLSPGRFSCETAVSPSFEILNTGTVEIESFTIKYQIDGGSFTEKQYDGLSISSGQSYFATLGNIQLSTGAHELFAEVSMPNGELDPFEGNNILTYSFGVDQSVQKLPDREQFEELSSIKWTSISSNPSHSWEWYEDDNSSLIVNSYNSAASLGDRTWLFSPIYDFSNIDKASVFFDVAHSSNSSGTEVLYLMVSKDCGTTNGDIFYSRSGPILATADPRQDFVPNDDEWRREYVNLTSLAGESEVRFSFMAVNGKGNNLYLDNIELYTDDDPSPLVVSTNVTETYPNPTSSGKTNITFNLDEKEPVSIVIYDRMGRRVYDNNIPNALNQTIEVDLSDKSMGIYIVRIVGKTIDDSFRLMVAH